MFAGQTQDVVRGSRQPVRRPNVQGRAEGEPVQGVQRLQAHPHVLGRRPAAIALDVLRRRGRFHRVEPEENHVQVQHKTRQTCKCT